LQDAGASNDLLKSFDEMTAPIQKAHDALEGLATGTKKAKNDADAATASIDAIHKAPVNLAEYAQAATKAWESLGLEMDGVSGLISDQAQQAPSHRAAIDSYIAALRTYNEQQMAALTDPGVTERKRLTALHNLQDSTAKLNLVLKEQQTLYAAIEASAVIAYGKLVISQNQQIQLSAGNDPRQQACAPISR
jgi:hypothetical protein